MWDQTTNKILASYAWAITAASGTLPACSSHDVNSPCLIPTSFLGNCLMADYTTDQGWGIVGSSDGENAQNAPGALSVRIKEWMSDEIHHALYMITDCTSGAVFPTQHTAYKCANPTDRPPNGSLFFLDYTDAQINAMNLPSWQTALLRALAHHGGYMGDTSGAGFSLSPLHFEGEAAFKLAGLTAPVWAWLDGMQGKGVSHPAADLYFMAVFSGIPSVTGPGCPSTPCDVLGHLHIADPCVAKWMAGQSGGCAP